MDAEARASSSRAEALIAQRKRFETCRAHAAWFYGIRLEALDGDDGAPLFVATLHALTLSFRSVPEIEGWLAALDEEGAPRGEIERFVGAREANA